jgi:hypothetical protein
VLFDGGPPWQQRRSAYASNGLALFLAQLLKYKALTLNGCLPARAAGSKRNSPGAHVQAIVAHAEHDDAVIEVGLQRLNNSLLLCPGQSIGDLRSIALASQTSRRIASMLVATLNIKYLQVGAGHTAAGECSAVPAGARKGLAVCLLQHGGKLVATRRAVQSSNLPQSAVLRLMLQRQQVQARLGAPPGFHHYWTPFTSGLNSRKGVLGFGRKLPQLVVREAAAR